MSSFDVSSHDRDLDVRANEERLRVATEAGRIGTYDCNLLTGKTICSETLDQIHGMPAGSLDGSPESFLRLVHPEDRELARQAIVACLGADLQTEIEFRIVTPDGGLKWIAGRARALRDDSGKPVRLVGAAYDITERKRTEKRLAAQYAITRVLAESETLAAATPGILRTICQSLDWDTGVIWNIDRDSNALYCLDVWQQSKGSVFAALTRTLRLQPGVGLPGRVWASGEPAWLPDVTTDGNSVIASVAKEEGLGAAFCFPLRLGAEVIGVMEFLSRDIRPPDGDLLRMFASIGSQIGQVIERMRAEEALRLSYQAERKLRHQADRARERTSRLQSLTAALSGALTAEQVADIIVTHALPAMDASAGVVFLVSEEGSGLRNLRAAGYPESNSGRLGPLAADPGLPVADAIRRRELITISTLAEQHARYPAIAELKDHRHQTLVAIPMFCKDRAVGAFGLTIAGGRTFDEDDRALLMNIGQQCAQALERARLYDAEQAARSTTEASLRALEASEAKFRRLFETNVIGVVFGESAAITGANQSFLDIVGYTYEDLLAGKLNWMEMTPRELRRHDERALDETRQRRAFTPYEKELIRKDGSHVPVLVGGASFQKDLDAPWVSFVLDLTERKRMEDALRQSESRLHAMIDQAPLGVVEADLNGRVVLANQKYCDITGCSQEDLLGKQFTDQMHPDDRPPNISLWERAVAGEIRGYCLETRYLRKDSSSVWARISVSVVHNQDSQPAHTLAIVEDITERKRLEERLLRSQKMEGLGVLAGGIAHDFNNLLTAVIGNASLALDRTADHTTRLMLEDVVRASEQAASLTRQMLAYAGKGKFFVQPIDLSGLLREMDTLLKAAIPKNVALRMQLAEDLPPIQGDLSQIQQLVMNLVINAAESIEVASGGSVLVATALARVDGKFIQTDVTGADIKPGVYVTLKVEDNGSGMDEETMSMMFDPFFTTKFVGRGLGLAAVYGIARGHEAAIQVSSTSKGSVFTVFLSLSEKDGVPAADSGRQELQGAGTILVVDDEEMVREATRKMLEYFGYNALLAQDGNEAVEIFRSSAASISLVLLDLTMPGLSGDQVLGLLKSIRPDAPVVISSGYDESEVLKLFSGCDVGFIQKPYSAWQLAEKVKAVLEVRTRD